MRHEVVREDFELCISGRIDGVMVEKECVVVEEIKTTRMPLDEVVPSPIHWGQVRCYAYMWAVDQGCNAVEARLTYVHLGRWNTRTETQRFKMDELAKFFNDLIESYSSWLEAITRWVALRDASIRQQAFPYATYRPGQREMAKAVYRAIRDQTHLMVQAATGIGKTMAALFPAIKALAEGQVPKVVFLTARTTGRLAAEAALQTLRAGGLRLRSVTVTAKDKVCFYPQGNCTPEECPCARGHFDRINEALLAALSEEALTRDRIVAISKAHQVCPFELTLEMVGWADCVIGDYNYAFAPGVVLQRLFGEEAGQHAVLVDEAHNLVDRSREMFSAHLNKQAVLSLRRALKSDLPALYKSLGRINAWMAKTRRRSQQQGDGVVVEKKLSDTLLERLQDFLWGAERWLMRNTPADFRQELLDLFFSALRFVRVAEDFDHRYVTLYEAEGDDLCIKLFCIDPSHLLQQAWKNCHAAILFSATLTPVDYFLSILGCPADTRRLNLPSPFPQENFAVFAADRISTYFRDREQSCRAVSQVLEALVRYREGHYLLFFPSYAYMEMIRQQFVADCDDIRTIVQTPDMQEDEREIFLNQFRKAPKQSLVGFAVLGGIFGEGIDLQGKHLTGAAIVGVGLPGMGVERDVIRGYYDQIDGSGFEFAYQYPGINRVLQAAGRVIRSETDRGVVLLIDRRYCQQRYRAFFPNHWLVRRVDDTVAFGDQLAALWQCN